MIKKGFIFIVCIGLLIAFGKQSGSDAQAKAFVGQSARAVAVVTPAVIGGILLIVTSAANGFGGGASNPSTKPPSQKFHLNPKPKPSNPA
jgi:hypothetical protein